MPTIVACGVVGSELCGSDKLRPLRACGKGLVGASTMFYGREDFLYIALSYATTPS